MAAYALEDETIVFAPTAYSALHRVVAAGGPSQPLTTLAEGETGHRFPQRLPGRQMMYYSVNRTLDKSGTRLVAIEAHRQRFSRQNRSHIQIEDSSLLSNLTSPPMAHDSW